MPTQPDPASAGILVGLLTLLAGFCSWALGHFLYSRLAPEKLKSLKNWHQYRAAYWGDLLILPIVNGLVVWMLYQIPFDPYGAYVLPILAAITITLFVHVEQAAGKQVNWTMPKPWRWNSFGFYHALFMVVNLTLAFLFLEQVINFLPLVLSEQQLAVGLFAVLAGWLLMLFLFFLDRRAVHV